MRHKPTCPWGPPVFHPKLPHSGMFPISWDPPSEPRGWEVAVGGTLLTGGAGFGVWKLRAGGRTRRESTQAGHKASHKAWEGSSGAKPVGFSPARQLLNASTAVGRGGEGGELLTRRWGEPRGQTLEQGAGLGATGGRGKKGNASRNVRSSFHERIRRIVEMCHRGPKMEEKFLSPRQADSY